MNSCLKENRKITYPLVWQHLFWQHVRTINKYEDKDAKEKDTEALGAGVVGVGGLGGAQGAGQKKITMEEL